MQKVIQSIPIVYTTPRQKNTFIKYVTSANKSYGKWSKAENFVMVPKKHDRLDDEKVKMVPTNDENNNSYDVVSDYKNYEKTKETFLRKLMMKSKQPPRPHLIQKWYMP